MIRKIKLYIVLVAVLLSASSCLDKYPQDAIPQEEAIKTVSDVRQALVGIYAQWFFVKFGGTSSIVNKESWLSVVCFLPYCTSAFLPL